MTKAFPELPIYEQLAQVGKALASPIRLRLLDQLEEGESTVEELAARAGVGLKSTSAQLQQLKALQLVAARRDGVRIHYRIASPQVSALLASFEEFAERTVPAVRTAVSEYFAAHPGPEPVTVEELERRMRGGTMVIDVRSAEEYAKGHVPGALSIPLPHLRDRLAELPADADVIAYCQGPYCLSSPRAVALLGELGREARSVRGGITAWIRSGRELRTPA
ncbi:ArsR/SmtB family transcription factor [Naumannella cuiyingiana]|uniref:Rhodanese-related sulfurtransferase n=1 Tax=Naumannella cuiyingiana TaxID=1347891 RepID=A0A7Z0DAX1_9ACTN|nr:ArsR family transcriptional regulator [Naumannella cuiyingiana]NYI72161.1 rhodanese-related sulfurtransferase [Naumannella cuiyingiana]